MLGGSHSHSLQVKICLMLVLCLIPAFITVLEAQRPGQGGWGGGERTRSGEGRGNRPESRKGKENDEVRSRFLRVCEVLTMSKKQLKDADLLFKSLQKEKQSIERDQQTGAVSALEAGTRLKKVGENFEKNFITLLDEPQKQSFDKLKEDKTIEGEWW